MTAFSRRRWLLGASALPAALMLPGCTGGGLPFLGGGRDPGKCLGPSEELPDEVHETVPEGLLVDPAPYDQDSRFLSSSLSISPDGSKLAASETSDQVHLELADSYGIILWDSTSGEVIRRITAPATGRIAWHPDGTRLAIGDSRHISVVDLEGNLLWNLIGHSLPKSAVATIRDLTFSPDGSQLASTSSDGSTRLWDMGADTCGAGHVLEPGARSNAALSYSPDGSVLAIGSTSSHSESDADNPPELWDPATGERSTVLDDLAGIVFDLGYAADGTLLVVTDDPVTLTAVEPDGTTHEGPVTASTWFADLAVGPGHRAALLGADDELLLWDRDTDEETRLEIESDIGSMRWSADERTLYCLSRSQGVLAWDGKDWRTFDLP